MNADFITVLWKEWKEIVLERSAGSTGSYRPLILIAVFGVFLPLRMGPERFFSVAGLLAPTFFSVIVITAVIADSFAGERERHTLETLLASRLSDRSILFGKIAACMAYGWLISISIILAGAITVNIANWHGQILMFHDAASWLLLLLGPPLLGGAVASGRCSRLAACHDRAAGSADSKRRGRSGVDRNDLWKQHAAHGLEGLVRTDSPDVVRDRLGIGCGRRAPGHRSRAVGRGYGPVPAGQAGLRLTFWAGCRNPKTSRHWDEPLDKPRSDPRARSHRSTRR